jgi:CMP-N-acetylneuraminic acid synthetase
MNDRIIYIIPAREGSKGFRHKNRVLIYSTTKQLKRLFLDTYISTDDPEIIDTYKQTHINVIVRPPELAQDETSMKDVLLHAVSEIKPSDDTLMVVLYPTYPQRTRMNIAEAINFFETNNCKSLLCRKKYNGTSPYLMMFPIENGKGTQVIKHNLYRRQDYPEVFEISHFIIIMRVGELNNLNNNLYNEDTVFYTIEDVVDVDTEHDFIRASTPAL